MSFEGRKPTFSLGNWTMCEEKSQIARTLRLYGGAGSLEQAALSPQFPANREFNREFLKIVPSKTALSFSNLHILQEKHIFCANPSREFSELYQGIKRTDQGFDGTDQGIWN